jgi:hypothetical protein
MLAGNGQPCLGSRGIEIDDEDDDFLDLALDIDRDEFISRILFRWQRPDSIVAGITADTGALAFIIEAAAKLTLTHEQRRHLIERIEIGNKLLIDHAERKMEWA